jgi:hypothetical protein
MQMSNKNPFEIRLEVLKMAKEMMDTNYQDAMNGWWNLVNVYAETANKTTEEFLNQSQEMMKAKPEMYTPAQMMEKAQELYSFVTKKD